jgi:hypothetical protein
LPNPVLLTGGFSGIADCQRLIAPKNAAVNLLTAVFEGAHLGPIFRVQHMNKLFKKIIVDLTILK